MNTGKRRGGYLATAEGVKKLKEAKQVKKYTYEKIAQEANETIDKVKRLFNPQWGNGQYKIGEEAVEAICTVLNLQPENIVANWYAVEIPTSDSGIQELTEKEESNLDAPYNKALRKIERAARDGLEELDLSGMRLTELPEEIWQLTNLRILDLNNNHLKSLPSKIFQLTNLTELYLYVNPLRNLSSEIGQLVNLKILDLSSTSLRGLPSENFQLTNLTELHLSDNSLNGLPSKIFQFTNLTKLYFRYNSLEKLPPEIGQLTNLT